MIVISGATTRPNKQGMDDFLAGSHVACHNHDRGAVLGCYSRERRSCVVAGVRGQTWFGGSNNQGARMSVLSRSARLRSLLAAGVLGVVAIAPVALTSSFSATAAGPTVFHLHLHMLGGRELNWPPG